MKSALMRALLVAAVAAVLVVVAVFTPLALREMKSFRVRRVEIVGAQHLTPRAAVIASGITRASNVFDDPAPWLQALERHPLVAEVRAERRLPGTIVFHVTEAVPVAFARTPELRAIDERGRVLPTDPAHEAMDLPVLTFDTRVSANGRAADEETRRVAAFLGIAMRAEPALISWISEIGTHGAAIRLVLRNATDAEVLVSAQPTAARLHELHVTLADLATPQVALLGAALEATGEPMSEPVSQLSRVKRIDVRFHDQIVVALHSRKS